MDSVSVAIVIEGPYADMKAGEPYAQYIGERGYFAYATDQDSIYRIDSDGKLTGRVGDVKSTKLVVGPVTGPTVAFAGLTTESDVEQLYRDNTVLYPDDFTVGNGEITLPVGQEANEEYFFIRFK